MDWKPRPLSSYNIDQLQKVGNSSPAFSRYLKIIKMPAIDQSSGLRLKRVSAWCELVAEIFLNNASPENICDYWSLCADQLIKEAWSMAGLNDDSLACFGLGKLGSSELNLSSDIDLIILSSKPCPAEAEQKIRKFTRLLADKTDFGFCFRVDYDLRPGGRFSPLVSSLARAEDHYWTQGQTWERLALVRSRGICGATEAIETANKLFSSYSYRKYINYSLFEDLKNLRSDIFQFRPEQRESEINLKLTDGGIRDIELFIHALQVIHGGRIEAVREKATTNAINVLIEKKCGDQEELLFLKELYWNLRDAENRSQAIEDSQTHTLKASQDMQLFENLQNKTAKAATIVSEILGKVQQTKALPAGEEEQAKWLKGLGFNTHSTDKVWPSLIALTVRSSRFSHDEQARQRVLNLFIERLSKGNDPNLGLSYLCDFIKSVRAKSSFFSLLLHEQKLIDDLANLFSTSPALSQIFVNRPELLDSFVFNISEPSNSDTADILEFLFEKKLLSDVRYSMDFLRGLDLNKLVTALSDLADSTFDELLSHFTDKFPSELQILKMGKWAGQELGLKSDLDLVFIAPDKVTENDYKVARRLISRVTENQKGGHFYQIDLRLRPTGSAGPLILSKENLIKYLQTDAEPWERQSYLRTRIQGPLQEEIRQALLERPFKADELKTLKDIRLKLYKSNDGQIDLKYQEGGLLDIEFSAQIASLQNSIKIDSCSTAALLRSVGQPELIKAYSQLRLVEQCLQLLSERSTSILHRSGNEVSRVAKVLNMEPDELYDATSKLLEDNAKRLKALDPIWQAD